LWTHLLEINGQEESRRTSTYDCRFHGFDYDSYAAVSAAAMISSRVSSFG
jgi:hypothetical protein